MEQNEMLELIATRIILDEAIKLRKEKNQEAIDRAQVTGEHIEPPPLEDYIEEAKANLNSWRKVIFPE